MSETDMVAIPAEPSATMEDLQRWDALKKRIAAEIAPLQAQERLLREKIVRTFFPEPKEGTNKMPLSAGWELKYTHTIKRDVDYGVFQAMLPKFTEANIGAAACLRQKWELEKKQYNTLTAEQKMLFDQCLTIKPESPQLEIVLPAAAAKKQAAVESLAQAYRQSQNGPEGA